ncbi:MAG TPA: hypothetical protein VFZ91_12415 [Allosphingosinicella sp.]
MKIAAFATAAGLLATPVAAVHSWNGYHWKRTTAQITPPVADNVTSAWDSYLRTANTDWNRSTVIESPLVAGSANPRTCKPTAGTIQVCNAAYGQTGWLGIASIWLSAGHISQGTTKVNDTYYASATYNTPAWRAAVMCQEIGHDYGLGHQDEDFNTDATNSCMEYTNVPAGNEHPDQHDYDQLLAIYNHVESASNLPSSQNAIGNSMADWGRAIDNDAHGRPHVFERDLGNGNKVITHVTWAMGVNPRGPDHD